MVPWIPNQMSQFNNKTAFLSISFALTNFTFLQLRVHRISL